MNDQERKEYYSLPHKYIPLSAWEYCGLSLLFSIPVVGFIILVITAITSSNINKRSFARSYFCLFLIYMIIILVVLALFLPYLLGLLAEIKPSLEGVLLYLA